MYNYLRTEKNTTFSIYDLILCSLLISLVAIVTSFIRIPTPVSKGYLNAGDIVLICCGFLLGGKTGALIGSLGSIIADISGGYFYFVPGTFVVKGLEGYLAGFIGKDINKKSNHALRLLGGICASSSMVFGYFLYESILMGTVAAAAEVIPNIMQGIAGVIGSIALYPVLRKTIPACNNSDRSSD